MLSANRKYKLIECPDCRNSRMVRIDHINRKGFTGRCRPCSMKYNTSHFPSNWKGGITPKYDLERGKLKRSGWHKKIFARDKYTCQTCNDDKGGNLESHHIKSFIDYPDERYNLDNGITLCQDCHHWIHDSLDVIAFQ